VINKIKSTFLEFYQRHQVLVSIFMFALGFMVDILTIRRIDSLIGLIQQGAYLVLLSVLLILEIRIKTNRSQPGKLWHYHNLVVHFLFGALLSLYTIFYYTSASALTSFFYILLLAGLMLANEFGKIRSIGLPVRVILFCICLLSYFSFLYPILMGHVGEGPFLLGVLSSGLVLTIIWLMNFRGSAFLRKNVLFPGLLIHTLFVGSYYTSLIPPVPLAVKKIGVYYGVEKIDGKYLGKHRKEFWGQWRFLSQDFFTRPGDKVVILLSIFSPTSFQDQIFLKWYYHEKSKGWVLEDTIPLSILGGRNEGYRGFGSKQFYHLGQWRVLVETSDGREVGRITFNLRADDTTDERKFKNDIF
jgi:hypothetical protein